MGTRRDEFLSLGADFVSSLRTEINGAIQDAQQERDRRGRPRPAARIASRLGDLLDLPPPSSSSSAAPSNRSPSASPSLSSISRPSFGRPSSEIPFSSTSSHLTVDLPPSPSRSAPPTPSALPSAPSFFPTSPELPDGDALPSYSRRAPVPAQFTQDLPPKRLHLLTSKSGKLALELKARGKEEVMVIVQEVPDSETNVEGKLKVILPEPEGITHIRVRVKGVVRTLVSKAQVSGRHPISDEICFVSSSRTLWTSTPSNGSSPEVLPSNRSSDPYKLHGTFTFPFSLSIPGKITHLPPSSDLGVPTAGEPLGRPIRPPPSFMLDSATVATSTAVQREEDGSVLPGSSSRLGGAGYEGSVRYYLKVTLGRKGMLKVNERWIVPLVFAPRQHAPTYSRVRELALREERPTPGSREDPEGWSRPGKYLVRESVRKGVWKTKSGWVELEVKVPRAKMPRRAGEKVEFEAQIISSNPEATGRFPPASVQVSLVQRTTITAQRLVNSVDTPLLRAPTVRAIGSLSGEAVPLSGRDGGGTGWKVTYGGAVKLTQSIGTSFAVPNLAVGFILFVSVFAPASSMSTSGPTVLATLAIPIEIVSCAPRPALTAPPQPQPSEPLPAGAGSSTASSAQFPPPPPGLPNSPPPPLPPTKSPSLEQEEAPASGLAPVAGPSGTANASSSRPVTPLVDEEAERRMEAEYGALPPSYFEVVEQGGGEARGGAEAVSFLFA
ncbi:hypothetical protein JCM8547_001186 [Rhodosporidiobolus lusitaniae]